jgi:hypothetical protein
MRHPHQPDRAVSTPEVQRLLLRTEDMQLTKVELQSMVSYLTGFTPVGVEKALTMIALSRTLDLSADIQIIDMCGCTVEKGRGAYCTEHHVVKR